MKTYQYIINMEDLTSRVPGLFPSMYIDEDGNAGPIMPSFEFPNGCWGNVVPDLKVPDLQTEENPDGKTSYRTLMNLYYSGDERVQDYVETALGKRYFKDYDGFDGSTLKYERFLKKHVNTPSMVYLATVPTLIKEYEYYKHLCECYELHRDEYDNVTLEHLCCICQKYDLMGGDTFLEWLYTLEKEETPSFDYVEEVSSTIPVILNASINDLGIFDLYINRWVAGKNYVEGEIVTYKNPITGIDDSYVCIKSEGSEGFYNKDTEITYFPIKDYCSIKSNICFEKINDTDREIVDTYEKTVDDEFENRLTTFKNDVDSTAWSEKLYAESNLTAVRRSKSYINTKQLPEYPSGDEDWFYYYREGTVNNIQTIQDELGNLSVFNEENRIKDIDGTEENLYAYGDVLISIEREGETLIFTYALGAHLTATLAEITTDIDGNSIYKYTDYKYDGNDKYHGIVYKETHKFSMDNDWTYVFENNLFEDLKKGNIDSFRKCKFAKSSNREIVVIEDSDNMVSYIAELAEYNFVNEKKQDYLHSPLMRNESLIGTAYRPNLDIDIYINRGNAAAFERHIKLGEVKTMEDLENYANGSFFNIQNLE